MEPRWVNICEREPELDREVQVLVVKLGKDTGYAKAKSTSKGWVFLTEPISTRIVAWLESERFLNEKEISEVPKSGIRF